MITSDSILDNLVARNKTPSVQYIVFDSNRIIHQYQQGFADVKNQKSVNWDTTFNWFSVTKTFTALAILQLAEKGKLNISERANKYLLNFPYPSNITVKQILSHSAGIPNPNPLSWIHLENEHDTFNKDKFFDEIFKKHLKVRTKPNVKFAYSNLGYLLLGKIIENVSGRVFEDYIQQNVISPLGIDQRELSFLIHKQDSHGIGYQKRFSFLNGLLGVFIDKSKFMGKAEGRWKPFLKYYLNGASYGGLIGTSRAFVKYIQDLLDPMSKIISKEYKEKIFEENITKSNKRTGMCLSWFKGKLKGQEYYTHAGGGGGYYCEIRIYRNIGLGSVIIFNRTGISDERYLDKLDKFYVN